MEAPRRDIGVRFRNGRAHFLQLVGAQLIVAVIARLQHGLHQMAFGLEFAQRHKLAQLRDKLAWQIDHQPFGRIHVRSPVQGNIGHPARNDDAQNGLIGKYRSHRVGEAALLPEPEQRPVERLAQRVVAALDRDADAFAEIAALGERTADEFAAAGGVGPVEPEGERDAVAEQQVGLALAQRLARRFHVADRA